MLNIDRKGGKNERHQIFLLYTLRTRFFKGVSCRKLH